MEEKKERILKTHYVIFGLAQPSTLVGQAVIVGQRQPYILTVLNEAMFETEEQAHEFAKENVGVVHLVLPVHLYE